MTTVRGVARTDRDGGVGEAWTAKPGRHASSRRGLADRAGDEPRQAAGPAQVYAPYRQGRIDYCRELAQARPALARFLQGWLARAQWFPPTLPAAGVAAGTG
ncbi:hypothetical protein JR065_19475 [Xanthomonas sp. AmX2]|uniref:hypothetical protein n=1 Tax=Xanthomonas sp. TaxID=29446 RepID=UPI00197CF431|nr:hypothetical protein [Xanthomonas sp.]MBN6152518.1 hypothetical protein [Xanthomonas sp.]